MKTTECTFYLGSRCMASPKRRKCDSCRRGQVPERRRVVGIGVMLRAVRGIKCEVEHG